MTDKQKNTNNMVKIINFVAPLASKEIIAILTAFLTVFGGIAVLAFYYGF